MVRLPDLMSLRELINIYGLTAKKHLAQNFLMDLRITDKICRYAPPIEGKTIIEVGPGPGGLTRSILKMNPKKVVVIEKDQRFIPSLQLLQESFPDQLVIIRGDALQVDEAEILEVAEADRSEWAADASVQVIGNLPFNISTPLLLKWLRQLSKREGLFTFGRVPFTLLYQKEVAERIIARPNTPEFARLSVAVGLNATASMPYIIPGSCFTPPPKVDAGLVTIVPKVERVEVDFERMEVLLRTAFTQRRKKLSNSLSAFPTDVFQRSGIDPNLRPQVLRTEDWMALYHAAGSHLNTANENLLLEGDDY